MTPLPQLRQWSLKSKRKNPADAATAGTVGDGSAMVLQRAYCRRFVTKYYISFAAQSSDSGGKASANAVGRQIFISMQSYYYYFLLSTTGTVPGTMVMDRLIVPGTLASFSQKIGLHAESNQTIQATFSGEAVGCNSGHVGAATQVTFRSRDATQVNVGIVLIQDPFDHIL